MIPVLQELLEAPNRADRLLAAEALAKSRVGAKLAVPTLINFLDDNNHIVAFFGSLEALGCIGPEAREALPVLGKLLLGYEKKKGYAPFVGALAGATILIDPTNKEAAKHAQHHVFGFISSASAKDERAAEFAVRVLGQLGPAAKAALPALENCLKHRNKRIQRAAQEAIGKITKK